MRAYPVGLESFGWWGYRIGLLGCRGRMRRGARSGSALAQPSPGVSVAAVAGRRWGRRSQVGLRTQVRERGASGRRGGAARQ